LISEVVGRDRLLSSLRHLVFNNKDASSDPLFEARELVSKFGDRQAIDLLVKTACDPSGDIGNRLQATEVLFELDYRELPRKLLDEIKVRPDADDWWVGDMLLRIGDKSGALDRFVRAIKSSPEEYRDQIARGLAELCAEEALRELAAKFG